jgi:hypothetical protein
MAVDHLSALEAFQKASPDSYAFSGQLSIAVLPQAHTDPEIAKALHRLVTDNVKYKLAPAATAGDLLSTTLMMGIMGIAFPEPTRSAYFVSLQQELKTKLKTSFGDAHGGWSLAGLYTLDLLASYVLGQNPDFAHAADGITRALESEGTAVKPLAHITARGVQYEASSRRKNSKRIGLAHFAMAPDVKPPGIVSSPLFATWAIVPKAPPPPLWATSPPSSMGSSPPRHWSLSTRPRTRKATLALLTCLHGIYPK